MKKVSYLENIIIGVIPSLIAMALYFIIEFIFEDKLGKAQLTLIIGLVVALVLTPITILIYKNIQKKIQEKITPEIIEEITPLIKEDFYENLQAMTGIVKIFPNYPACDGEILEHLQVSKNVKIFLQIGKTVLAGTTNIYDYLASAKLEKGTNIKILHTNINNPHLSKNIADKRGSFYEEWVADTNYAYIKTKIIHSTLTEITDEISFESKLHNEGYIWRFFIFDDYAYVQPYLYKSNNSEQAPVYKISKYYTSSKHKSVNNNSLYIVFLKLFNLKWEEDRKETKNKKSDNNYDIKDFSMKN